MKLQWIKIATDIFESKKIKLIKKEAGFEKLVYVWFSMLVCAGQESNGNGYLKYGENLYCNVNNIEDLACILDYSEKQVARAIPIFQKLEMIRIDDDGKIAIANWEEYQSVISEDKRREQAKARMQAYRERKKASQADTTEQSFTDDVTQCYANSYAPVTQCYAIEEEKEREEEKESIFKSCDSATVSENAECETAPVKKTEKQQKQRFVKPTLDELNEYMQEANIHNIDSAGFIDYYDSCGWKIGNKPMKDWRATVRNWSRRKAEKESSQHTGKAELADDISQYENIDWSRLG